MATAKSRLSNPGTKRTSSPAIDINIDTDPLAPLRAVPHQSTFQYEDLVQAVVWRVGRTFGFQAFNVNPLSRSYNRQQYVPSTIFLAGDHLVSLLVKNMYVRQSPMEDDEERWARAVWTLHGTIFGNYEDNWCPRVKLPPRLNQMEQLAAGTFSDPNLINGLLCELSLYFLMYTEAANLRHVPEFLWFLFWSANTSPHMESLIQNGRLDVYVNGRARRQAMRNAFQQDIAYIQQQLQHDPAHPSMTPADCFTFLGRIKGKVPHPSYESIMAVTSCELPTMEPRNSRPIVPEEFGPADVHMYEDLIALGDGGFWCDRVVTPVFYVLAYEMDARFAAGTEVAFRLGYDDINECASNAANITEALHYLRANFNDVYGGVVNSAHDGILSLGLDPDAAEGKRAGFDPQRAAVFWASKVFTKTYRERRTWLAIYRSFYRIYSLHFLMIHILMAHAFSGNDIKVISSAVVTHAFLHFFERLSNWYMSRTQQNPLNPRVQGGKKGKGKTGDPEAASADQHPPEDGLAEAAKTRTLDSRVLEGDPVLSFFGCWEWGLVAIGLLILYIAQHIQSFPAAIQTISKSYWLPAAGGYTALMLTHGLITTRDGYCISLTSLLRLPRLFSSSSARPRAQFWLDGNLRIGYRQFFLLVVFWVQTLGCKGAFDYFVIYKPLVPQIKLILQRNWLSCAHDQYTIMGSRVGLACIDGDWVLVVVRVVPFILVCLMDTHIFYQITLVIWGVIRGICVLDIGVVGNWETLISEFHQGPVRWWNKVLSRHGNTARLSLVAMKRAQAAATTSTAGYQSDHAYDSDSGTDPGFYSGASDDGDESGRDVASLARERLTRLAANKSGQHKSKARYPWRKAHKAQLKPPSDMALILQGQSDEHVAMWDAFAAAWDEIVTDLREADMVSNREQANLRFTRLCYDRGLEVSGVRPILMPAFFFAGQIQKAVDTGITTVQQSLVMCEGRTLLVWLGAHLELLPPTLVSTLLKCAFVPEVVDLAHQQSRQRCLQSCIKLLGAIAECAALRKEAAQEQRRRQDLAAQVQSALSDMLRCLQVECQAVLQVAGSSSHPKGPGSIKNKFSLGSVQVVDVESLQVELAAMLQQLDLKSITASLHRLNNYGEEKLGINAYWGSPAEMEGSTTSAAKGMSAACDSKMVLKVVNVVLKMMTLTPAAAKPASEDAQRVLSFFMSSLANKQLTKPKALHEMLSWTVLTPCYEEDVLYPLEANSAAKSLGCAPSAPRGTRASLAAAAVAASKAASHTHSLTDLCSESEDRVSLMAFLRSVFPLDWDNFKERLSDRLGVELNTITEESFVPGAPLADMALELQLWASYRGQLLARTVRGMMCYDRALRVLARLEHPCPPGMSRSTYDAWIKDLVSSKFSYVVSAQVYGRNRSSRDVRNRWLAEGVDVLLEVFEQLKVAFLDTAAHNGSNHQHSVLIRGRSAPPAAWEAAEFVSAQRVEELYRVRLPQNRYSPRGVIIGEGKPENQNHAIIFCLGEGLQTIDMNQDNNVAEAYKMRNLLDELDPEILNAKGAAAPTYLGPAATGRELREALAVQRKSVKPTALVGFCEHIFSDRSGALGSFAASAEFAFGTIVQRTMDTPGNVRMHYGHPDVFNKLHIMTRGGVSKATRQLHISEDIFGGYSHTLRGARIRYREYISVGKGRDMGFDSINAFEIKISGGAGEVVISRDLWRLSTRMDFFRLLHFYHSGIGYYVNTWLVMHTVFAQIFTLCLFAMARAGSVGVEEQVVDPLRPQDKPKYMVNMQDTLKAEYVLQLGTLSLLPYLAELALEHGIFKCVAVAIQQIAAGSWAFFVFKQQTTSYFFFDDMAYGGAMYIGTGRGFSITTSHFLKLWTNYSRSHILPGVELMSMCFLLLAINDCPTCSYGALTWGVWLVSASLVFAPFWFNPMIFSVTKVKRDFLIWSAWLRGEVDPDSNTSWHTWHRKQMEKARNDRGNQTNHKFNTFLNVLTACAPLLLLALAAVSRLDVSVTNAPGPLQSSYILFLVATIIIWALLACTMVVYQRIRTRATNRRWRLYGFWTAVVCIAFIVVYLAILSRFYSGNGFSNLLLILYANVNLLFVTHRAAAHLATKSPHARALVDSGYLLMDMLVGYSLLCVLYLLSCTGIVAWLQATLLFNPTFAKSIRRGQLVRTIGMDKADAASQQPEIASIEMAVSSLRAASPAPQAVPRSRGASMVATRMQITASRVHVDDSVY